MDIYERAVRGFKALDTGYLTAQGPRPTNEARQAALVEVLRNLMHQADMSSLSFADALKAAGLRHHRDIIADAEQEALDEARPHAYSIAAHRAIPDAGTTGVSAE